MKTTDNQAELFDLVNEMDEVIGTITRKQAHSNPKLFHRSVGVLIFNDHNELYLQKRSMSKDMDPGFWSVSASGHLNAGQDYESAALREVEEELGVKLAAVEFLKKYIIAEPAETEINALFKAHHNGPFIHHPEEVADGKFFKISEIDTLITSGEIKMTNGSMVALRETLGILQSKTDLEKYIAKRF